ncbi:MAG: flavodoxin family protein [Ruminococcaceae bacterium]|nr:flavodoxin family protein [Oscillospiraceae bacterium]
MVKLLGICGSPRVGATEYALREALVEAEKIPGIATDFWTVHQKKISPCLHCDRCIREKSMCFIQDDYQELEQKLLEADGYIIASPVYDMGITAQLTACFNRNRPSYLVHPGAYKNKVGGGIAVGGTCHGGQETALSIIGNFFLMNEILVTGGIGGCYNGGTVWSQDRKSEGAADDIVGMGTVRGVGRAVAQAAWLLKKGQAAWDELDMDQKAGRSGVVEDHAMFEREE